MSRLTLKKVIPKPLKNLFETVKDEAHVHAYTVPVEWIEVRVIPKNEGFPQGTITGLRHRGYRVTRLMCQCGEQIRVANNTTEIEDEI